MFTAFILAEIINYCNDLLDELNLNEKKL